MYLKYSVLEQIHLITDDLFNQEIKSLKFTQMNFLDLNYKMKTSVLVLNYLYEFEYDKVKTFEIKSKATEF